MAVGFRTAGLDDATDCRSGNLPQRQRRTAVL
jgi:hypothetical protein